MNTTKRKKEPGVLSSILACVPMLNWLALIWLGIRFGAKFSLLSGIAYGWISFRFYDLAPFIWVIAVFQYWIVYTCIICRQDSGAMTGEYEEEWEEDDYGYETDDIDIIDVEFSEVTVEEKREIVQKRLRELPQKQTRGIPQKKDGTDSVELDFSEIEQLRKQSAEVRSLLEVSQIQLFLDELSASQKQVLRAILSEDYVWEKIERIAEKQMSMPELLIDEINELAMEYLEDIVIDVWESEIHILEQYKNEIRKRMK